MKKIKVVHSVEYWLPQTMTWLHGQVSHIPPDLCENLIVCERTMNLDQFPVSKIASLNQESGISGFSRRVLRKTGVKVEMDLLDRVIEQEKPDILHSHFGHYGWLNHKLALKHKVKHVVTFYGVDVNMLPRKTTWQKRYQEMFRHIDICLCEGPFMASCLEKLGCAKEKIQVQRLGVNLEKIQFIPRKFTPDQTLHFLIAGTFREKKGIPYALEALGLLQKTNPDFIVTLIGDAGKKKFDIFNTSRREKTNILEVIKKYNLHDKIRMPGFISHSEMIRASYEAHIFISPSVTASDGDTEGGAPVGIIEMAAGGMPVISTKHCDIPFVLSQENIEILSEERNSRQLVENIEKFLQYTDDKKNGLMKANRKFIEENLNVKKCAKQLLERYQRLVNTGC